MSYEKDFIAARKAYLDKVLPLKPSGALKTFVEEERCKILAKGLDDANGDVNKMKPAHIAYNEYYKKYIGKIDTQIKKETVDKSKLKIPLSAYELTLATISNKYLGDFGKLFNEEKRQERAGNGVLNAVSAGANAAAGVAAEKTLKRALEDFKAKRTLHLNAISALNNETGQAVKDVNGWHATASAAVNTALNFAKIGRFPEARNVADGAIQAAKLATAAAEKLQRDYDTKITQGFQKDRNLGFPFYEGSSEFGLQKSQEGAFKAGQKDAKAIFDKAVELGTKTLGNIKSIALLAKQAQEAAASADDAANVKDIRPSVRSSLQSAQSEIDKIAALVLEALDKHRTTEQGLFPSANRILTDANVTETRARSVQEAPVKAQAIEEMTTKIGGSVRQVEQLAKAQVGKVPPQLKSEEEFKNALMKLGSDAGNVKRQYNLFVADGEKLVQKLKALK